MTADGYVEGHTAVKYFQQVPQRVKVAGITYDFAIKANICMAWIKDEHVSTVLALTKNCCGGRKNHPYRLANEADIRRWSGISER